ncbi:SIP domain-containing protein [Pseudooceanicola algae]|uniref:SIP domain-containing protein n=1 Tax=Pseudooceanicola algae TaxID=1537215 RepID=UPI0038B6028A
MGDSLTAGGSRGSREVSGVHNWLLIGGETALPAMGRFTEKARGGDSAQRIAAVRDPSKQPDQQSADPEVLPAAVRALDLAAPRFLWIAAEASVAKAVRARFTARDHPLAGEKARAIGCGAWRTRPCISTDAARRHRRGLSASRPEPERLLPFRA